MIIKITFNQARLKKSQRQKLEQLSRELRYIEKHSLYVDKIVARGGFVLDTILGVEPNDIDLFYSLKGEKTKFWQGCKCEEIKKEIRDYKLELLGSRKVDLGHVLEGEMFFEPVEKCLGYFSHHIDYPSMICLDSKKQLWSNDKAWNCIKNKTHEVRYEGWLQHFCYPYSDNPGYRNYITNYARLICRGLRMINSKSYKAIGPNFLSVLENSNAIFNTILSDDKLLKLLKDNLIEKCSGMSFKDYETSLEITKAKNRKYILLSIKKVLKS